MDAAAYQKAKTQSFFDLGLTFTINGDQLAVNGLSQFKAEDRAMIQTGIRDNKVEIMAEVVKMQDRLKTLVDQTDNSKGLDHESVARISAQGSEIIRQLSPEVTRRIFENS